MALWNMFPFSNFHELNLDWLINNVKELTTEINETITNLPKQIGDEVSKQLRHILTENDIKVLVEKTYGAVSYLNTMQEKNIVLLGDSLTDANRASSWVIPFSKTMRSTNSSVTSLAHSGDKLKNQADLFSAYTNYLDILWIWVGINDVRDQTPLETMVTQLDTIRDRVQTLNPSCQVFLCSTYKNDRGMPSSWIIPQTAYWRMYSQYCEKNGWTFVDLYSSAPIISTATTALTKRFFVETSNFLHYNSNYTNILASYILKIMTNQTTVPLGDYSNLLTGSQLGSFSNIVSSVFTINTNGSFVEFGTRNVKIRIAGTFKAPDATSKYTKIATLPSFLCPKNNNNFSTAYRAGGDTAVGGELSLKAKLNSNGDVFLFNTTNEKASQASSLTVFVDFLITELKTDW